MIGWFRPDIIEKVCRQLKDRLVGFFTHVITILCLNELVRESVPLERSF
jgi:hypothetical protein